MTRADDFGGSVRGALPVEQRICVDELSHHIGRPMLPIGRISWDSVGYVVSDGSISGLSLYGCGLTSVPTSTGCLSDLKHLNLRRNAFVAFPSALADLPGLVTVSCERNQLATLPSFRASSSTLRSLYASHNAMTSLTHHIGHLRKVECLDLDQNQLDTLPDDIGGMTSMTVLNLGSKKVSTLADPDVYGEMPLTKYGLDVDPPRSPFELQAILLKQTFNRIRILPDTIGHLSELRSLSVVGNRLTELPDTISRLSRLREIDASYNLLRRIPESFASLPELDLLDLSYNRISSMPKRFSTDSRIRRLVTRGNPLVGPAEEGRDRDTSSAGRPDGGDAMTDRQAHLG